MFKKYYKSLNDQIVPDEKLVEKTKKGIENKRFKTKPLYTYSAVFACFAVLIVSGLFLKESNLFSNKKETYLSFMAAPQVATNRKLFFDAENSKEEFYSLSQIIDYLGEDFRPDFIPDYLTEQEDYPQQIVFDLEGNVVYDNFNYGYYENIDAFAVRSINIQVSKGKLPQTCTLYLADNTLPSKINGHEILASYSKQGVFDGGDEPSSYQDVYYAEFVYSDIGYIVNTTGLTEDEFIQVLDSIIK